jgi:hypothetical protein
VAAGARGDLVTEEPAGLPVDGPGGRFFGRFGYSLLLQYFGGDTWANWERFASGGGGCEVACIP